MSRGIVGTLQLVGTAALVVPVVFFGLLRLLEGEVAVAGLFFGLAALMLVVEEYYTSPRDLPAVALERAAGWVATDPDDGEE